MAEHLWITEYLRERDSWKRKAILEDAIAEEGMTPENELRSKLLAARYVQEKTQEVDAFLRGWMHLQFLGTTSTGLVGKKRVEQEKDAIREDWQLALARSYGEAGETVLYQEFCHTAWLYVTVSRDDNTYRSVFFGLGRMKDDRFISKVAQDFFRVGYTSPARLAMQEELQQLTKAVTDTFCELFPEQKDVLLQKIEERKK